MSRSTPDKADFLDFLDTAGSASFETIARHLARYPNDVHLRSEDLTTPLHHAVFEDHAEVAALIIDYGADINARADDKSTALMWAANMGSPDSIRVLLERGADWTLADDKGETPLDNARRHRNETSNSEQTNATYDKIIAELERAAEGKITVIPPSPVTGERKLKLSFAVAAATGNRARFNSILSKHPEAATWVEPASQANALLNIVAEASLGVAEAAQLLAKGADVNVADLQGWTPLACAAIGKDHGVFLDMLIDAGANPLAKDKWGQTPADIAEINKNPDVDKIRDYEARYRENLRREAELRDIQALFHGSTSAVTVSRPLRFKRNGP